MDSGKRQVLYAITFAVFLLMLVGLFFPRGICPAKYRQIRAGMTRQQVEAAIGLPSGDYFRGPQGVGGTSSGVYGLELAHEGLPRSAIPQTWYRHPDLKPNAAIVLSWWGNRYVIDVAFDESGAVVAWTLSEVVVVRATTLGERIQMWLGP
jgi:hypothetical protein